ncbi:MAG TPA: hypothetical protein VHZ25_13880 [Acidobacteriaceae bacterium]|jgi:hypothetical protein|nr:hypothetical protein [Acidobacteriaceae bacterium]
MTLDEFDQTYPNGLVDAEVTKLTIDYQTRAAKFAMNLRGNLPDEPNSQEYRQGILALRDFYYVSIEPPDSDHLFYPRQQKIVVSGHPEDPSQFTLFESVKPVLPASAFCCRLYVHDWNSFIHVAAEQGQFAWTDEKERSGLPG